MKTINHYEEVVDISGVSVLRTFRLLRIFKLIRFLPALRRQLIIMLKTMDNVATFFLLFILFIFVFRFVYLKMKKLITLIIYIGINYFLKSILGMHLFACKFCKDVYNKNLCPRKNFDSFLWSTITVFQVSRLFSNSI